MATNYYEHINDFEGIEPVPNAMPPDVKRLISHTKHTYNDRFYFFSPSDKSFYRYYEQYKHAVPVCSNQPFKKSTSERYQFIPDADDGTPNTPNIRDNIVVSDRFMKRVENMNKLILPSMRKH